MRVVAVVACLLAGALAWDTAELDLFDLVEEVQAAHGKTCYDFLGVDNACTSADVRRAYKKLALLLHPDKNDAADADLQFRQLAAVYEVLKDKELRERYDTVLVEGLPSWKSTAYYFRRMRKIGLAEGVLYLLVIITGIQYCVNWAAYLERKFTVSEHVTKEVQRRQKKLRRPDRSEEELVDELVEEEMAQVGPPPTWLDTLPFQLARAAWWTVMAVPGLPGQARQAWEEHKRLQEVKAKEKEEWEEEKRAREEEKVKKKEAKAKRKNVAQYREAAEGEGEEAARPSEAQRAPLLPRQAGQLWTDPELAELAKLIKRIPGGTGDRWERIAEALERTAAEVTKMAGRIKNNPGMVPKLQGVTGREKERLIGDECLEVEVAEEEEGTEESQTEDEEEEDEDGYVVYGAVKAEAYVMPEEKKKKKTKAVEAAEVEAEEWSQAQQRSLEAALAQLPKGSADRWDRIAARVEGRTKEQCIQRFRALAEQVKKKKAEAAV
jgi:DnaJ family protein C protein 1